MRRLRRLDPRGWLPASQQAKRLQRFWDRRARTNARYFVATGKFDWSDEEFFASGVETVANHILSDMFNICQGKPPGEMRVLEIGCGAGRVTRALAGVFGEVHAVDVSGEMARLARVALTGAPNARVYHNNGLDLSVIPDLPFDFAFSTLVFQHIPSRAIVENYIREAARLLRPGALFKFQVRGNTADESSAADAWVGVAFSDGDMTEMAEANGFEARYRVGAGTQDFWLWFFRKPPAQA
ncbi:MAG TPA: class I SAM-dependent methyltransferase [Bryobacteraceae bacterium]|nr:class I SAM-dependent methyltransferase [Bryobacteraceae bacterium]